MAVVYGYGGVGIGNDSTCAHVKLLNNGFESRNLWTRVHVAGNRVDTTGRNNVIDRGGFDADYNCINTFIQYNYSHDNGWFCGIMKRPTRNVVIRYNISQNDREGIYFYGFESDRRAENVHIYNNTHFVRKGLDVDVFANGRTPVNTRFENNIFYFEDKGDWGKNFDITIGLSMAADGYVNIRGGTLNLGECEKQYEKRQPFYRRNSFRFGCKGRIKTTVPQKICVRVTVGSGDEGFPVGASSADPHRSRCLVRETRCEYG